VLCVVVVCWLAFLVLGAPSPPPISPACAHTARVAAPSWTSVRPSSLPLLCFAARRLQKRFPSSLAAPGTGTGPNGSVALHPHLAFLTGGAHPDVVVAKAYARIASVYLRQNRGSRAINALVLSYKMRASEDVKQRLAQVVTIVSEQARAASGPGAGAGAAAAPADPATQVPDVEDIAAMHEVSRYGDRFKFECTGCGECCRSADHIFLSPFDLFNMSRAENLQVCVFACGLRCATAVATAVATAHSTSVPALPMGIAVRCSHRC
jgi:hypothetical protein